ncbi:protein O-mannosyl-transferase TMTC2-like [Mytilus californianus]|uniref:protein O-mannosyl-transferase TMTC2-like n=1 Tax=Mytilus californianus TaxID=6549 RepID=UPI002245673E|nr:protein O-mannosyl-transferase TMTC2-like [Mytilus californianus]
MDYIICLTSLWALVLYLNTLTADFAYDDSRAILKNQDLLPDTPIINIIYDDFWGTPLTHSGSHKSYRPICVLSFRLNYLLGELEPFGYHLGNIILHAVVTALFTHFARIVLQESFPTLIAGLLFAAHPVHTEAVAGIVGRADVGACLFFLLALLSYMKYVHYRDENYSSDGGGLGDNKRKILFFIVTAICTTLSMLTKEQGVTVIAVCAAYDLFVQHKVKITDLLTMKWDLYKKEMEGLFLLFILGAALVAFRFMFMGNKTPEFAPSDNPAADSNNFLTKFLTFTLLPVYNFWILLCPRVLSFDWSMEAIPLVEKVLDARNSLTLLFYTILGYFSICLLKHIHRPRLKKYSPHLNGNGIAHHSHSTKHVIPKPYKTRRSSNSSTDSEEETIAVMKYSLQDISIISLSILIFPFIPATNIFFYVGFVIAERVLYIPSMGFCLFVAYGAYLLHRKYFSDVWKKQCVIVCVAVTILLMSGRTVLRNDVWDNEENLYRSGIQINPAKAWANLANVWNQQGKLTSAEYAYKKALTYRGNMADTHYNLGILYQDTKRYDEAIESYTRAISYRPKLSMAHLNLGILYANKGKYEEAEKVYKHCADLDTSGLKDPRLHANTKISALYNLGRMYAEMNRHQEAIDTYKEALKRRPSHYAPQSIYNMMGEVYTKLGKLSEAEHWYREALKSKPDHIPAHLTMAKLYHKQNKNTEAEEWFKKAKEVSPDDPSVDHHYAHFLSETGRLNEAAQLYEQAIIKSPQDFELVFNAANTLRQVGNNERSEQLYKRATTIKPNSATAHMNLGAMYHINSKHKEAEASYLRALELKPDDVTTQQNLVKLRNLMSKS